MKRFFLFALAIIMLQACGAPPKTSLDVPLATPTQNIEIATNTPEPTDTLTPLPTHTYTPTFTNTPTSTSTPTKTATPTVTPVPTGAILYYEDFEDSKANNWFDYFGTWTIETEGENHYWNGTGKENYPHAWISLNTSRWGDYAFESRIRIMKGGLFICSRWSKKTGFYNAFLDSSNKWVEFAAFDNKEYKTFGGKKFRILKNQWMVVRFEVQGTNLRLFIDNQLATSAVRDTHDKGGVGFYMGGGDEIHFDNIRVWQLSTP